MDGNYIARIDIMGRIFNERLMNHIPSEKGFKTIFKKGM